MPGEWHARGPQHGGGKQPRRHEPCAMRRAQRCAEREQQRRHQRHREAEAVRAGCRGRVVRAGLVCRDGADRGDAARDRCDGQQPAHRRPPRTRRANACPAAGRQRADGRTGTERKDGRGMTGDIGRIVAGRGGRAVKHHMNGGRDAGPGRWSGTLILGPRHRVFGAGANGFCNRLYGAGRTVSRGRSISIQSGSSVSCIRVLKRAAEPARQSVTIGGIRPDTRSSRIRVTLQTIPNKAGGKPADAGGTEMRTRRACTATAVSGHLPLPRAACPHA